MYRPRLTAVCSAWRRLHQKHGVFGGHEMRGRITPSHTENTTVADGTACALLPGLFNCHVHVDEEESVCQFPPHGVAATNVQPLHDAASDPASGLPSYQSAGLSATHPGLRARQHAWPRRRAGRQGPGKRRPASRPSAPARAPSLEPASQPPVNTKAPQGELATQRF